MYFRERQFRARGHLSREYTLREKEGHRAFFFERVQTEKEGAYLGLRHARVVIVDPPRKGLCADVLAALAEPSQKPRRLIYVSCGFDALKRDLDALERASPARETYYTCLF